MKKHITFFFFFILFKLSLAQISKVEQHDLVVNLVELIKNNNLEKLKHQITFPLRREYPLPDVKDEMDFIKRYAEIFDSNLITEIIQSDYKNDWVSVGWRGIMLNHGTLWLDYDGKIIAINYQSIKEKKERENLIEIDKDFIHSSVKRYLQPKLLLETDQFKIRVDELSNGEFRYASWSVNSKMNEKPDLIIKKGIWLPDGSGGNNHYEFVNGVYKYFCSINVLGTEETPPADLKIFKNGNEILYQPAIIRK